ncbi:MAG: EF-hand domain-containing protein [Proteobacteria bacterium]|nr:EF-hand domain-containing protein [Pseudomonadota bacterium]
MVSSIGSNYSAVSAYTTRARPDPTELASKLFSKLDTKGQGYIQESDLESAFSQVYSSSSSATTTNASSSSEASSDASQLFSALDSDGNGQVTESEFSSGMQQLAEALDSQAFSSRMQGAGGMPPPHGHGNGDGQNDSGFTKDQLTNQLQEIGSTDSKRSSLISDVVNNFDKADADGDGKVTRQEAMAYEQSQSSTSSTASSTTASTASTTSGVSSANNSDAALMHRLMELMRTYGANSATSDGSSASSIAVSA